MEAMGNVQLSKRGMNLGFTLIELMIAVAIVAILVRIALPAYQSQVIKTRRTDAQQQLVSYAQALERYFSANGTYLNGAACGASPIPPDTSFYTYTLTCTATTFTLTATPVSGGMQRNDGNQILDNTGAKTGTWQS